MEVYQPNVLFYRCASTNFEELCNVTVSPSKKPAEIVAEYEAKGKGNYRLLRLETLGGRVIKHFEPPKRKAAAQKKEA